MSIRGLDEKALAELKRQAEREGSSLNALVVRLLQSRTAARTDKRPPRTYDDLDALAGTWSAAQARAFELWIAASCMEHGAALLTLDAHFRHVGGLRSGAALEDFLP